MIISEVIKIIVALLLIMLIFILLMKEKTILNKRKRRKYYLSSNLYEIDRMTGEEFEKYLEALFHKAGYRSNLTKSSHDYGADLIMQSNRRKIVIQAKRYKGKVGVNAVMQVYSAKGFYGADEAYVFTNSYFTNNAKVMARKLNVTLCDRNQLVKFSEKTINR